MFRERCRWKIDFGCDEISFKRKREARGLPFCRYHDG